MHCSTVQSRLVAWQDDELSPGESVRVTEHLAGCADCRDSEVRLASVPFEPLVIPPEVAVQLAMATDVDFLLAEAARPDRPSPFGHETSWRRWLTDAVEVPAWTVLAAAAALALTVGWAVQMTAAYSDAHAEAEAAIASRAVPETSAPEPAPVDLPADQFQPASYQPGEDHGYR